MVIGVVSVPPPAGEVEPAPAAVPELDELSTTGAPLVLPVSVAGWISVPASVSVGLSDVAVEVPPVAVEPVPLVEVVSTTTVVPVDPVPVVVADEPVPPVGTELRLSGASAAGSVELGTMVVLSCGGAEIVDDSLPLSIGVELVVDAELVVVELDGAVCVDVLVGVEACVEVEAEVDVPVEEGAVVVRGVVEAGVVVVVAGVVVVVVAVVVVAVVVGVVVVAVVVGVVVVAVVVGVVVVAAVAAAGAAVVVVAVVVGVVAVAAVAVAGATVVVVAVVVGVVVVAAVAVAGAAVGAGAVAPDVSVPTADAAVPDSVVTGGVAFGGVVLAGAPPAEVVLGEREVTAWLITPEVCVAAGGAAGGEGSAGVVCCTVGTDGVGTGAAEAGMGARAPSVLTTVGAAASAWASPLAADEPGDALTGWALAGGVSEYELRMTGIRCRVIVRTTRRVVVGAARRVPVRPAAEVVAALRAPGSAVRAPVAAVLAGVAARAPGILTCGKTATGTDSPGSDTGTADGHRSARTPAANVAR